MGHRTGNAAIAAIAQDANMQTDNPLPDKTGVREGGPDLPGRQVRPDRRVYFRRWFSNRFSRSSSARTSSA